ncbi:hypothetical protein [Enterococcus florum]|nr:hypothetical protein [Enterococcus florum]
MEQSEKINDWLFRYQYVYRVRRTEKQKRRFLSALVADLAEMREDVRVIEYNQGKKYSSNNVYVGNIKKADRIICTYYDTPPKHFGSYPFFDRKQQSKHTTNFIMATSAITLLIGLLATLIYMKVSPTSFQLTSPSTIAAIICFGLYFFGLSRVAKGLSERHTLVRNTSSLLAIMEMISRKHDQKTAFAFVDEGTFGENGIEAMKRSCKASAKIYVLDSIGSDDPLYFSGTGISKDKLNQAKIQQTEPKSELNYFFSGKESLDKKGDFFLDQAALKQKQSSQTNCEAIIEVLQ